MSLNRVEPADEEDRIDVLEEVQVEEEEREEDPKSPPNSASNTISSASTNRGGYHSTSSVSSASIKIPSVPTPSPVPVSVAPPAPPAPPAPIYPPSHHYQHRDSEVQVSPSFSKEESAPKQTRDSEVQVVSSRWSKYIESVEEEEEQQQQEQEESASSSSSREVAASSSTSSSEVNPTEPGLFSGSSPIPILITKPDKMSEKEEVSSGHHPHVVVDEHHLRVDDGDLTEAEKRQAQAAFNGDYDHYFGIGRKNR